MLYLFKEIKRDCCTSFIPKDVYKLDNKGYSERFLESGFCPKCGSWVVTLCKRNYNGDWVYETAKRKKALKLYNDNKNDIIGNFIKNVKSGNKSNMGFRYGENIEVRQKNKTLIKQYATDFNGTKNLIKTI